MKSQGFSIYLSPVLRALMDRYKRDHPEVSLSKLCSGFLGQYLYDRGYRPDGKEGTS